MHNGAESDTDFPRRFNFAAEKSNILPRPRRWVAKAGFLFDISNLKIIKDMKKFFNDNMWWIMIVALVGVGYCVWTIRKNNDETSETVIATE